MGAATGADDGLTGLITVLLIFNPGSDRHYHQRPERHGRKTPSAADWPAAEHILRAGPGCFLKLSSSAALG